MSRCFLQLKEGTHIEQVRFYLILFYLKPFLKLSTELKQSYFVLWKAVPDSITSVQLPQKIYFRK